jgi:hypothetical protein
VFSAENPVVGCMGHAMPVASPDRPASSLNRQALYMHLAHSFLMRQLFTTQIYLFLSLKHEHLVRRYMNLWSESDDSEGATVYSYYQSVE